MGEEVTSFTAESVTIGSSEVLGSYEGITVSLDLVDVSVYCDDWTVSEMKWIKFFDTRNTPQKVRRTCKLSIAAYMLYVHTYIRLELNVDLKLTRS